MEIVLHSEGKEETIIINGQKVRIKPNLPTVVPDKLGKALLERPDRKFLTVKDFKKWQGDRDAKAKKSAPKEPEEPEVPVKKGKTTKAKEEVSK